MCWFGLYNDSDAPPVPCMTNVLRIVLPLSIIMMLIASISFSDTCDPKSTDKCDKYYPIKAVPYKYSFVNQTCNVCSDFQFNQCFSRADVPCYDTYVQFKYQNGEKTCYTKTVNDVVSHADAYMKTEKQYKINETYYMVIQKYHSHGICEIKPNNFKMWFISKVMLILFGAIWGLFVLYSCYNPQFLKGVCLEEARQKHARHQSFLMRTINNQNRLNQIHPVTVTVGSVMIQELRTGELIAKIV
jgi:hypothetical protein